MSGPNAMWRVKWTAPDGASGYCLKWGDNSPPWDGTREWAEDRASKMTATSHTGTVYVAESVPAEGALP